MRKIFLGQLMPSSKELQELNKKKNLRNASIEIFSGKSSKAQNTKGQTTFLT